jgi:hypothetical protein
MSFPVTINGVTYTEADFTGYGYKTKLPALTGDIATVAGQVAANAGTATTQAGIATTKAGEASGSAASAAQSVVDCAALFDQFDDRYLGVKASDPTLDNDGNALVAGALYINSGSGFIRVYTGSAWVQGISTIAGVTSINGQQGDVTLDGAPAYLIMAQGVI